MNTDLSSREQAEKAANRIRDELAHTVDELERRREHVTDVRALWRENSERVITAGIVAIAAATTLGLVYFALRPWREERALRRYKQQRRRALYRAWAHPERLAVRARDRAPPSAIGRKVLVSFLAGLGGAMANNASRRLAHRTLPAHA